MKQIYIQCSKCKGTGSKLEHQNKTLVHVTCSLCKGTGGRNFSARALRIFLEAYNADTSDRT